MKAVAKSTQLISACGQTHRRKLGKNRFRETGGPAWPELKTAAPGSEGSSVTSP